ncbi:MAG: LysR family transcriptional regulator [Proteobacteria bacterium]|nr:LysR family transcriptional regulator [Pseudomonadota bacterium]MDA1331920.1 LysR family transcriptional regulator [Pseudomonadota bacterium]
MSKIKLSPSWSLLNEANETLGAELFGLLNLIHRAGTLAEAAKQMGISYRHAWNIVKHWKNFFGSDLVNFTRGKGASLTDLGEKLLWAEQRVSARVGLQLDSLASEINREINRALTSAKTSLTIHATFGYAVAHLPGLFLKMAPDFQVDLRYISAAEALASLNRGDCDLAGFHLPTDGNGQTVIDSLAPLWTPNKHRFIHLVTRTQGLFVLPNNPLRISCIKDLVKKDVKFVNRQIGSGTRMLFDQLLTKDNVLSTDIKGYQSEEFTHAAVAAFVASGMADAGFGVQPAATQFGLDFIPLARENYMFACQSKAVHKKEILELIKLLKSEAFANYVLKLPGYSAPEAGKILTLKQALSQSNTKSH